MKRAADLRRAAGSWPFWLCTALLLLLWWPALVWHRTLAFGDSLAHGWPLLALHAAALHGHGALLWSRDLYGGHPLFAEGQGGFAHPLNILFALLVTPRIGALGAMNLLHLAHMLIAAAGMVLLGRRTGLGGCANAFAALAVCFSPAMLLQQNNITIGGALAFVPFCLWAFETWIDRPGPRSAGLLAAMLSLLFLCGYPQTLHALSLVLASRLIVPLLHRTERTRWRADARTRLVSLGLAALLFVGLVSVQLLPLLQLASLSHRAGGVELLRVLHLRTVLQGSAAGDLGAADLTRNGDGIGLGSLLVWVPATLAPFLPGDGRRTPRLRSYALAALLGPLAAAGDTPVFALLHDHGLLPGMRFFRVTAMYLEVGIVPAALLAGLAIDRVRRLPFAAILAVLPAWAAMLWWARPSLTPPAIATAAIGLLLLLRRPHRMPLPMLGLLLVEIVTLRLHPFPFVPIRTVEALPETARIILARPDPTDRRLLSVSLSGAYGLLFPHDPRAPAIRTRMLDSLAPMTTLARGIPSMGGALALPLRRRMLAEPLLDPDRIATTPPPGARLPDLLSVRFLYTDGAGAGRAFRTVRRGDDKQGWLFENDQARPFVQGFAAHVATAGPDEAARVLAGLSAPALVIEDPERRAPADAPDAKAPHVVVLDSSPERYRIDTTSDAPGWVVVSDADCPGWIAEIDGRPATVFPAQLLAKAVPVPAGRHVLMLRFRSLPFEIGLAVSLLSLCALGAALRRA